MDFYRREIHRHALENSYSSFIVLSLTFWACHVTTFFLSSEFHIIVCGLDSIVARRWINGMVVGVVYVLVKLYILNPQLLLDPKN